jgi:hypothetical protein
MERGRDEPAEAMSFYCHWKNMEIWVGTINQSIRKSTYPRKCLFLAFQKIYNSF